MKKDTIKPRSRLLLSFLIVLIFVIGPIVPVRAENTGRRYLFKLDADGNDTIQVNIGDTITVVFTLEQTEGDDTTMYAMQNEIQYDTEFFELVPDSLNLEDGIRSSEVGMRDNKQRIYMNYLSSSGGKEWEKKVKVGSFQLKVIGEEGTSTITNEDYLVSTADGKDHFQSNTEELRVVISTECRVQFMSNGGTEVPEQTVVYGEMIQEPEQPTREGYEFKGWYHDIDTTRKWNFNIN